MSMCGLRISTLATLRILPSTGFLAGCAPTLDVGGVYFPGWLVAACSGVAIAYGLVAWLAKREGGRALADSGVFFLGMAAAGALSIWWLAFGRF